MSMRVAPIAADGSHTEDDLSQLQAQRDVELALLRHRQQRGRVAAVSASACEDCGGPIPAARQAALPGVVVCVECQRAFERRMELRR